MISKRAVRYWTVVICVVVIAAVLFVALRVEDQLAERYASRQGPRLFFTAFEHDLLTGDGGTFVIAHNAGDSVIESREALRHGADIIEIDVIPFAGQLYASHSEPRGRVAARWFRGATVRDVLDATPDADAIQLDLKSANSWYLGAVVELLNDETYADRIFLVSSRSATVLKTLADRAPHALRALSIGGTGDLDALRADPEAATLLDGVTIRASLLNGDLVTWLRDHGLFVSAWVVNDVRRANELIALGVGALTTDNLALMQAIGRPQQREHYLSSQMRPGYQ